MTIEFFDANVMVGTPIVPTEGSLPAPATAGELLAAMDGYGVRRALVWHAAQRDAAVPVGNGLITATLKGAGERLSGCWGFLPDEADEWPSGKDLARAMRNAGVCALRCWPVQNRFLLNRESCGRTLAVAEEHAIPLILQASAAAQWESAYALLREYPRLVCILADVGLWGVDRYVRPLFEHYPNVVMEISEYQVAGGVAPLVERYGARRLLFGSGFPRYHAGGGMLMIRHADIPETAKAAIAGTNLEALLAAAAAGLAAVG